VEKVLDRCKELEISEKEINEAVSITLSGLVRRKEVAIHEAEYLEKISRTVEFPILNRDQMESYFKGRYLERFNREFEADEYTKPILDILCLYFTNDPQFNQMGAGFNLNKGLLLFGPVGCGKTSMISLFTDNQKQSFRVASCRKISDEYEIHGKEVLSRYTKPDRNRYPKQEYFGQDYLGWCFDDFGTEPGESNRYGNKATVMSDVLFGIYEGSFLKGNIHMTTNINSDQITAIYGDRVRSRMRELFNVVMFKESSPDRRR
jgi:DNA replication protein DnaC